MRRPQVVLLTIVFATVSLASESVLGVDKGLVDGSRTLTQEPAYESTPQYSLLLLGATGSVKVWIVEDGRRLYVDKNANGDLTDDGPPLEPRDVREINEGHWDFNYFLDAITPADGSRHTDLNLRRWNYGEPTDSYGLSLTLNGEGAKGLPLSLGGQMPMYAGWFGTFWSSDPQSAPIIHFGGPLTPHMLREKVFTIGSGTRRLSIGMMNPGSGPGTESRLSIDALPPLVLPRLEIDWPTREGDAPLQTSHDLTERCCYWEFYTTKFQVPDGIVAGTATVSVRFPGLTIPFELVTTEMEVAVVDPTTATQ